MKPLGGSQKTPSTNPRKHSSSPAKHQKVEDFYSEPIAFHIEEADMSKRRQTLVFHFLQ
jgi:hypothetical protein